MSGAPHLAQAAIGRPWPALERGADNTRLNGELVRFGELIQGPRQAIGA